LYTPNKTSLLAVILGGELTAHNARLKQRQQSTSGAQHKHIRTPREPTLIITRIIIIIITIIILEHAVA
jgi:hypothetical protein